MVTILRSKLICLFLSVLYFLFFYSYCTAEDANTVAEKAWNKLNQEWFSSKETTDDMLFKPLMTGEKNLYTLDLSQNAPATIQCLSKHSILDILIQPSATKDLQLIAINIHSSEIGIPNTDLDVTIPVSGICSNGFISCDPGTWQNCTWYKWTAIKTATGISISYNSVAPDELAGCFCINESCTTADFITYKNLILQTIGTGIVNAITHVEPRLGVGYSRLVDVYQIEYYSNNVRSCNLESLGDLGNTFSGYSVSSPEDLFSSSVALTAETENVLQSQQSNEDSLYSLIVNSVAYSPQELNECEIIRDATVKNCQIQDEITNNCLGYENNPDCELKEEQTCDVYGNCIYTYYNFNPTTIGFLQPSCKTLYVPGECIITPGESSGFATTVTPCVENADSCLIFNAGQIGDNYWCDDCAVHTAYQDFYINFPEAISEVTLIRTKWDDYMQIFINDDLIWCGPDSCSDPNQLPSSGASCERNTSWDWNPNKDVTSYFKVNGKIRILVRVAVAGCGEGYAYFKIYYKNDGTVCRDWWKIKRVYRCATHSGEIPDMSRVEYVSSSINETDGGLEYSDKIKIENTYQTFPNIAIDASMKDYSNTCVKACKLIKQIEPAQAGKLGYTSADYRYDETHDQYIYRICENNTCPVRQGESLLVDCQCINEFNQAVSAMQTLKLATIDMVCTKGPVGAP